MAESVRDDQWVWVVVQDPGESEQFLGQYDQEKDVSFIPAFREKDEAEQGLVLLPRQEGHRYEVHAIRFDDLVQRASEHGFRVFLLKGTGEILEKSESKE
jgi:hypothetical protein